MKIFTVDPRETAKFEADAALWWDEERGPFAPLHAMNLTRVGFIREARSTLRRGDRAGDWSERHRGRVDYDLSDERRCRRRPRSRTAPGGSTYPRRRVRWRDPWSPLPGSAPTSPESTRRREHRHRDGSRRKTPVRRGKYVTRHHRRGGRGGRAVDAVVSLEVVEHVNDPEGLGQLEALTNPGGAVFMSTVNRTARSYALAIVAAERVLRWVSLGTHEFEKFMTPEELAAVAQSGSRG